MIIDSATLLVLSIIFASLSITEKVLLIIVKKKSFLRLKNFVSRNKKIVEDSIKNNKSITIDDEYTEVINDVLGVEEIVSITHEIIDLIKISK